MSEFRILAVRVLDGCAKHIQKCLVKDTLYYLCNDIQIVGDSISWRKDYVRKLPTEFFDLNSIVSSEPHISLSAIVGMNGDGKSSLTELIIRLINNCACGYMMDPQRNLIRVEGVKAELYYQSDYKIYRIVERNDMIAPIVQQLAEIGNDVINCHAPKEVTKAQLEANFFYTLVNNYSHYAYNLHDFKDEITYGATGNSEEEKYWLYRVFHKNDGYQTPISLHPYRTWGNINVNREKELSDQRLLSLIMSSTSSSSANILLDINGKEPFMIELTLLESTKLREKTIKERLEWYKNTNWLGTITEELREIGNRHQNVGRNRILEKDDVIGGFYSMAKSLKLNMAEKKNMFRIEYLRAILELASQDKATYLPVESDLNKFLSALETIRRKKIAEDKIQEKIEEIVGTLKEFREMSLAQIQWALLIMNVIDFWTKGLMHNGKRMFFQITPDSISCKDEELDIETKCRHYIIYKTISIFDTYPEYSQTMGYTRDMAFFLGHSEDRMYIDEFLNDGFKTLQKDCDEKSHITLKLRQTMRFYADLKDKKAIWLDSEVTRRKHGEELEAETYETDLSKVREKYGEKVFDDFEMMPPRIFTWDLIFRAKNGLESQRIPYRMFSSGEKQFLQVVGAVLYHLHNIDSIASNEMRYQNINLVFEEIELYFHPEWQRKWVYWLIAMLRSITYNYIRNINVILVTHSPFVLSDIPKTNVLFLKDGRPNYGMQMNTFGANIHHLLKNGFFLPGLPMGEFAHRKIDVIFAKLNEGNFPLENLEQIYDDIMQVGEPVIRNELLGLYNGYRALQVNDEIIERILRRIQHGQNKEAQS